MNELVYEWDYTGWRRLATGTTNPYKQKDWNQTLMTCINKMRATIIKYEEKGELERDVSIPNKLVVLDVDENLFHLFETLDNFHPHLNPNKLGGGFLIRFYSSNDEPRLEEHKILFGDLKRGMIEVHKYRPTNAFDLDHILKK